MATESQALKDASYESMLAMAIADPHHYVSYYFKLSVTDELPASSKACFTALKCFLHMCGIHRLATGWENSAVKCQRLQSAYAALQEQLRVRGEMMTTQEKNANEVMIMALTALHKLYQTDAITKGQQKTKRLMLPTKTNEGYARNPYHCRLSADLFTWMVIFVDVVTLLETWQPSIILMLEKCNHTQNGHELDVNTIKMNLATALILRMLCFWTHAERTNSTIPHLTISVTIGAFAGNHISSTDWKNIFAEKFLTGSQLTETDVVIMTAENLPLESQLNALTHFIVTNVGGHLQGFVHRRFFPFLLEAFNLPYCWDGIKVNPIATLTQSSSTDKINNRSHSADWPCKDLYEDCKSQDSQQRSLIFDQIKRSILAKVGLTLGRCDRKKQLRQVDFVVTIEKKSEEKCQAKVRNTPLKRKAEEELLECTSKSTKTSLSFAQAIFSGPTNTISATNANAVLEGQAGQSFTPDKQVPLDGDKTADADVDKKHLAAVQSLCELQMSKENMHVNATEANAIEDNATEVDAIEVNATEVNTKEKVHFFVPAPPAISNDGWTIPGHDAENDESFT